MDLDQVMRELEAKGTPTVAKTYARHGVTEPTFGVRYSDLDQLAKRLRTDHNLALSCGLLATTMRGCSRPG